MRPGAEKRFDRDDDIELLLIDRPYFRFTGEAINRTAAKFHTRTGGFIRDEATLKTELRREGIEFDSLRDPWGQPYQLEFVIYDTRYSINARSSGTDRNCTPQSENADDLLLWTSSIDYAREFEAKVDLVLDEYFQAKSRLPHDDAELAAALGQSKIPPSESRDPWGHSYYATFKRDVIYGNRVTIYSYAKYGETTTQNTDLKPVTQYRDYVSLRSNGPDGKPGTVDDFNVATISRLTAEQSANDREPQSIKPPLSMHGSSGAISGTVIDPNGGEIPR